MEDDCYHCLGGDRPQYGQLCTQFHNDWTGLEFYLVDTYKYVFVASKI